MDQHQRQRIALFRFGVIAELVDCPLGAGEREARVRRIAEKDWQVPFSGRQRVSRSTVLASLARYEASGRRIESLMPRERRDRGSSKSISAEDEQALVGLRRELPAVSLPVLLPRGSHTPGALRAVPCLTPERLPDVETPRAATRAAHLPGSPALRGRVAQRPVASRLPARPARARRRQAAQNHVDAIHPQHPSLRFRSMFSNTKLPTGGRLPAVGQFLSGKWLTF